MINEQDKAIAEYLQEIGVKYSVKLAQIGANKDGWQCDRWLVSFDNWQTEYNTGIGHRIAPARVGANTGFTSLSQKQRGERTRLMELIGIEPRSQQASMLCQRTGDKVGINGSRVLADQRETFTNPPTQASVLYCLLLDMDAEDYSFREWCANLGYDDDSRKAERIYFACQDIAKDMRVTFNAEQIDHMRELLQDY